jgi:hypothetical protein
MLSIEAAAAALGRPIDLMEQGRIPKAQIYNAIFREFTADPVSAVEKIYGHFGMEISAAGRTAMGAYMLAHPREKRGHVYHTGGDELISHDRQVLRRYQEYFKVPNET